MKQLLGYLIKNGIDISVIAYIDTEYNECGGYISFFDADKKELDYSFFNEDDDYIFRVAEEFIKQYNLKFMEY